jgi:SNF2 family DNA or RNA helicase
MSQFKKPPYTHQLEALAKAKDKEFFAYLMEMRTGKSKTLMDEAAQLFREKKINGFCVVTMTTLCRMWANEQIPIHLPDDVKHRVLLWQHQTKAFERESREFLEPNKKLAVLFMNIEATRTDRGYDFLLKFLKTYNVLLAIDESTIIKTHDSTQTKVITKLGKLAKYRRILTGTPSPERPLDLYGQFNFLKEGCLGHTSFYSFKNRYAVTVDRYFNGRKFKEIIGYQRLEELQQKIEAISYRKLRRECFDIPEQRYVRYVEMSMAQEMFYKCLRAETLAWLSATETVSAPLVITRLMRLRQALCNIAVTDEGNSRSISDENPRMEALLATLEEAGDKKVIIWSHFVPSIMAITEAVNKKFGKNSCQALYGDVSAQQRDQIRVLFQDKKAELRYVVIQPGIGGFGLDLTAADTMVYHDHDYSRLKREQSETRILGPMQMSRLITYIDLVAKDTLDETQLAVIAEKKDLSDKVTGDNLRQLLGG